MLDFAFSTTNGSAPSNFDGAGAANATASITTTNHQRVAPAGIWFEATGLSGFTNDPNLAVYEPYFHDMTFIWDFGESGDTTFAINPNIPTVWDDRNIAFGRRACHVYRNPGAYTVTLWCFDKSGNWSKTTTPITVDDPDLIYTGTRTICFADDSDFTGAPAGAQQVTTTAALLTAIDGLTQPGRVLFRAGSDTADFTMTITGAGNDQGVYFGAWGAGARPIIRPERDRSIISFDQGVQMAERVFHGLDLRGSWDPTHEVGGIEGFISMLLSDQPDMLTMIHDCRMSGFDAVNLTTLKDIGFLSIISDSIIEDWSGYGFFGNNQNDGVNANSRVAFIGAAIQQNPNACLGPIGLGFGFQMSNEQGPIRYASTKQFMMRSSYLFSNTTWTGNAQPCIRAGSQNVDGETIFDRVTFEGGVNPVEFRGGSNHNGNFLLDRALILGTADTNVFLKTDFHGMTIRNVYGWMPNVGVRYSVESDGGLFWKDDTTPLSDPVKLYNTTALYLETGSNNNFLKSDWSTFSGAVTENNIHHAPSQNTPVTTDNPDFAATLAGVTPRYAGRRLSVSKPSFTADGSSNVMTFAYPTYDGVTLTSGDFDAANGRHYVKEGGNRFYRDQGDLTVSLGGSITITKTSGNWPAGTYNLGMEYQNISTDGTGASPATVPLPRPTTGNPPFESASSGERSAYDFLMSRRPGSPYSGAPAGTASQGATEPA